MKTGIIDFPFAYLQMIHVKTLEAIVLHLTLDALQDFERICYLGAL